MLSIALLPFVLGVVVDTDPRLEPPVTFTTQPAQVGDTANQAVHFTMRVEATQRREREVLAKSERTVERTQSRRVTTTEVVDGQAIAADVEFTASSVAVDDQKIDDPVVGKTYRCRREGETLRITTAEGGLPSAEEYEVVARAMQSLGKPNPLAVALAGKTLRFGDRVEVPTELAASVVGVSSQVSDVERFTLTFRGLDDVGAKGQATFRGEITAVGAGSTQMRLIVFGGVMVDPTTCRVGMTDLSGPMAMSERQGVGSHAYQIDTAGKLRVFMVSLHAETPR